MKRDPLIKNPTVAYLSDLELGDRVTVWAKNPRTLRKRKCVGVVFSFVGTKTDLSGYVMTQITFDVPVLGCFVTQWFQADYLFELAKK